MVSAWWEASFSNGLSWLKTGIQFSNNLMDHSLNIAWIRAFNDNSVFLTLEESVEIKTCSSLKAQGSISQRVLGLVLSRVRTSYSF